MKILRSLLLTVFFAFAILLCGYLGIVHVGEQVLLNSGEPQPITFTSNISNLFYSQLEDDIQLYPWNYYNKDEQEAAVAAEFFYSFPDFLEEDLYSMIAAAAEVERDVVVQWYRNQQKSIVESMVQGKDGDKFIQIYFYEDVLTLEDKQYQVRMACGETVRSFSCIQCRDDDVKDSEAWEEHKAILTKGLEQSAPVLLMMPYYLGEKYVYALPEEWYLHAELFYNYLQGLNTFLMGKQTEVLHEDFFQENEMGIEQNIAAIEEILEAVYRVPVDGWDDFIFWLTRQEGTSWWDQPTVQVIELKDNILLVFESDMTVGLYYDVIDQRIAGFHFF